MSLTWTLPIVFPITSTTDTTFWSPVLGVPWGPVPVVWIYRPPGPSLPVPLPASLPGNDVLVSSKWESKDDPLFGPYQERSVPQYHGRCFKCGGQIDGIALEKYRGGTTWTLHLECPRPPKKGKRP